MNDKAQTRRRSNSASKSKETNKKRSKKNKDYDRPERDNDILSTKDRDNDPNWYFTDRDVANQAAAFSFDQFIGVPTIMRQGTRTSSGISSKTYSNYVPSILRVNVNPSMGITSDSSWTEGINQAGLATYSMLSSMNAKTTGYAPQDVTIMIGAMGQLVAIMEHIRRAFGVAFTYNVRNREMPHKLIESMGFDPDEFLANIADHRLQFNSWVTAINKLPFLDNIAYLHKCAEIYQKVYCDDSDSNMAQLIYLAPYSTWLLDETTYEQGGMLSTYPLPTWGTTAANDNGAIAFTWSQWANNIDAMLQNLFSSATLNYIYSDVLNYSSKTGAKLLYLDYLREDYVVVPEYNETFLMQVHNSTCYGAPRDSSDLGGVVNTKSKLNNVYPSVNTNGVFYRPTWDIKILPGTEVQVNPIYDVIMDCPNDTPTVEDRIEYSRLMSAWIMDSSVVDDPCVRPLCLPDFYVVNYKLAKGDGVFTLDSSTIIMQDTKYEIGPTANQLRFLAGLGQVDWAPIILGVEKETGSEPNGNYMMFGDVNYFTTLDYEYLRRVNDLAMQSLFRLR